MADEHMTPEPITVILSDEERLRLRREKRNRTQAQYRAKYPDKISASQAEWRSRNRERSRQKTKAWREANPERAKAAVKAWIIRNPERVRLIARVTSATRRARVRQIGGSISVDQILDLLNKQKFKCASCRISLKDGYHLDHINPISKGGSHSIDNAQLLCPPCNIGKGAKNPIEWANELGRLL